MSDFDFTQLPDLAAEELGGAVLLANDEFFAEKENLLRAAAPEWREHEYTTRGKWMDGWETRRRREPGHDWAIVRLGLPGTVRGVVVDTSYFRGNYPAECSLEGCALETANDDLTAVLDPGVAWTELLPRTSLQGNTKNAFLLSGGAGSRGHESEESAAATLSRRFTHLRLRIYPDGGVARLRVHGEARPDWARMTRLGGPIDLAALENGARSLVCSDMFFGSRNNLILPGRPQNMSSGWETRRRRGPGHDWNIVQLGAPGVLRRVEVDTTWFKGNAPGRISLDGCHAPGATVDELTSAASELAPGAVTPAPLHALPAQAVAGEVALAHAAGTRAWRPLLRETKAQPHTRHVFEDALRSVGPLTHVRLNVFPDGGVARLRAWGEPAAPDRRSARIALLNGLLREDAVALLRSFCASTRFCTALADARPLEDAAALLRLAERTWFSLGEADLLAAFAAHPRIGARKPVAEATSLSASYSAQEQAQVAAAEAATLARLAELNAKYEATFGFVYLVCANAKPAGELLEILELRLARTRPEELRTAAEEQAQITRLRLQRWLDDRESVR